MKRFILFAIAAFLVMVADPVSGSTGITMTDADINPQPQTILNIAVPSMSVIIANHAVVVGGTTIGTSSVTNTGFPFSIESPISSDYDPGKSQKALATNKKRSVKARKQRVDSGNGDLEGRHRMSAIRQNALRSQMAQNTSDATAQALRE